jgi:ribosomal protein S18 acetylase RimI-like enzyme
MGSVVDAESKHYDESFRETVTLKGGTEVVLRLGGPGDRELLRRGFERLSPESRYLRFFTEKLSLSEKELRYLTVVDGEDHFVMGAVRQTDDGEEGIGIGRFIRDSNDPEIAEPAVAVVDGCQGKGLGTLLLRHLMAAASERGIRFFHCVVLANNEPMKHLLEELSSEVEFVSVGDGSLEAMLPIPESGAATAEGVVRDGPVHRLFSHVARDAVSVPLGRRLLKYLGGESTD